MRLPPPLAHGAARSALTCVAAVGLSCISVPTDLVLAAPPSAESQASLKKAFSAAQSGSYSSADTQLGKLIVEWENTKQPDDETAALYKTRGMCRQSLGRLEDARADLSKALQLSATPGSKPDPAEVQRTYQLRARVNRALGNAREQAGSGPALHLLAASVLSAHLAVHVAGGRSERGDHAAGRPRRD